MRLTNSTQDYLLFRGSLDNILAQGRFDTPGRLLEAGKAALIATHAVAVQ
jgi:hypothetical protein